MVTEAPDLAPGNSGEAVRDLQRRLRAAGFDTGAAEPGTFDAVTTELVQRFQTARGLPATGVCDRLTWTTLVEAGFRLGDRHVYLRTPMLRGDDVAELQHRLGAMGFDAGRIDGIFGPNTERALKDFQRNMGLTTDGVLGRDTRATLLRLGERTARPSTVAGIRDRERAMCGPRELHGQRVVIGEPGGLGILLVAVERSLTRAGADVLSLHDPDPSLQAQEANRFDAAAFVGLAPAAADEAWFYENRGFQSHGGRSLATLIAEHASDRLRSTGVVGGWHPLLRETKMPAVQWNLSPATALSTTAHLLAATLHDALTGWLNPPDAPPDAPPSSATDVPADAPTG